MNPNFFINIQAANKDTIITSEGVPLNMDTGKKNEELTGRPFIPADLVEYQEGSVVSRMIVYRKAGTITLFAFDAGQGLSEHTAQYDAVITLLEGEAVFTIGGEPNHLVKGEMLIMPAGVPHAVDGPGRFKMMLTMIHGE